MFKHRIVMVLLGVLLVVGLSAAVSAGCDDECSGSGCYVVGYGNGTQDYFNRCVMGGCGSYSADRDHCQITCWWTTYFCDRPWPLPDYECDHVTQKIESCFQP